jgi:catechol 2,3-dioxygenase-like lactoylglutathione lyase family enzyme
MARNQTRGRPRVYSHLTIGTNDLDKAQKFYDALFTAVGGSAGNRAETRIMYAHNGGLFLVTKPINGEPATHANGGTIGLAMSSPEEVEAWHAAGVANGGTTCENPPGIREMGPMKMYLAYLRDPDNNKLCAMYRYG